MAKTEPYFLEHFLQWLPTKAVFAVFTTSQTASTVDFSFQNPYSRYKGPRDTILPHLSISGKILAGNRSPVENKKHSTKILLLRTISMYNSQKQYPSKRVSERRD